MKAKINKRGKKSYIFPSIIVGIVLILSNYIIKYLIKIPIYLDYLGFFIILLAFVVYFIKTGSPLQKSWKHLREIKNYVWLSCALFLISILLGYFFPVFFRQQIIDFIKSILLETQGLGTASLIKFIFINNLKSSFFAMLLGLIFGIFSAGVIIINGYVLGFVANKTVAAEGFIILWKLLPHGIFEIPAILISVAMGLKLGTFLFIKHKNYKKDFYEWATNCLRTFIFIVIPLLIIAAIIEGTLIIILGG